MSAVSEKFRLKFWRSSRCWKWPVKNAPAYTIQAFHKRLINPGLYDFISPGLFSNVVKLNDYQL